jgi:hypothetical protein
MLGVGRFHFGHIRFGLNGSRQIARQMDRNLVMGLLVWHCRCPAIYLRACLRGIVEFRKIYNENVDNLPLLQQIDLYARTSHFMH